MGDPARQRVLQVADKDPSSASEAVIREALGDEEWNALPGEVKDLFAELSPAVLAELRGRGLDLSEEPLDLSADELASIGHQALIVSGEDSPEDLRLVNDRLAEALPHAEKVLVTGGHLINPAHPAVMDFVGRMLDR